MVEGDASEFVPFIGDIIVTGEFSHIVWDVSWNGSGVDLANLGTFPNQPEDGIFVTAAIINPCPPDVPNCSTAPEPDSLVLLGVALLAALGIPALFRRRLAA